MIIIRLMSTWPLNKIKNLTRKMIFENAYFLIFFLQKKLKTKLCYSETDYLEENKTRVLSASRFSVPEIPKMPSHTSLDQKQAKLVFGL